MQGSTSPRDRRGESVVIINVAPDTTCMSYLLLITNCSQTQQLGNIYFPQSPEAGKRAMAWLKVSHKAEI